MEDYLKAIYYLQREEGTPVTTSQIADYLDVTSPTVTSMAATLESESLLDREKYTGVELTPEGERVALEVIRHHRLLEAYLTEHLDFDWSEVHDEADALEHHISERLERRLAAALGDPEVDPHGAPIPDADLAPPEEAPTASLDETRAGDRVVVDRVSDHDDDELAYLKNAGITPGTTLKVTDVASFGMVTVVVGDETAAGPDVQEVSLPEAVARSIRVVDAEEPAAEEA